MKPIKPGLLIFASGSKEGGGSGFEKLCIASKEGRLRADIVAVVSNHEQGGVRKYADVFGIPFIHFPKPWVAETYQKIVADTKADFVALSGWLKLASGLDPKTTFNIHPGPLPQFGGAGMYGHFVHEAVLAAYKEGTATNAAVTMHFVTDEYDRGPTFFVCSVPIMQDDTAETLAKRVNLAEHEWQATITDKVVSGEISWDGKDHNSLKGALFV